ncbi:DUF397 domain-containing protein [Streptomyces sp. SID5475]|nr:DUF397 domain-containing protein [Streptomyces sp. SID5475]
MKGHPLAEKTIWQKSSYSQEEGECVELAAAGPAAVALRESDHPGAVLTLRPTVLGALLRGVKAGEFDGPAARARRSRPH